MGEMTNGRKIELEKECGVVVTIVTVIRLIGIRLKYGKKIRQRIIYLLQEKKEN